MHKPPTIRLGTSLAAILAVSLLSGCATNVAQDPSSPYYQVPPGSMLKLNHSIEIPPGRARVFIQHGAVSVIFDHYAPNCNVEVDRLDYERVQYVKPGEYPIRRVQRSVEEVVQQRPVRVAALGPMTDMLASGEAGDGGDGTSNIYEGYHLWLDDRTGNFTRLSCRGAFAYPVDARPPSIDEMQEALGEIGSLIIGSGSAG